MRFDYEVELDHDEEGVLLCYCDSDGYIVQALGFEGREYLINDRERQDLEDRCFEDIQRQIEYMEVDQ